MNQERAFSFIPLNGRGTKPRQTGLTEIRGPYYSVMGERYLADVLDTMGWYVDGLKFAGGSFALMPRQKVKALIDLGHAQDVYVSTGGWIEHVLTRGRDAVDSYIRECRDLGFDVIELSTGFISLPAEDLIRLVKKVATAGLKAKPELGIQFGAGGDTPAEALQAEGTRRSVGDRPGKPLPRRRRLDHHDRIGGDNRERRVLAHRRRRPYHQRRRPGERHV